MFLYPEHKILKRSIPAGDVGGAIEMTNLIAYGA
jgi:hypothetical protein